VKYHSNLQKESQLDVTIVFEKTNHKDLMIEAVSITTTIEDSTIDQEICTKQRVLIVRTNVKCRSSLQKVSQFIVKIVSQTTEIKY